MRALVRAPSPRLADGQVTHIERAEVDLPLAFDQWRNYCLSLSQAGFQTITVPGGEDLPDSVFIEDTVVMLGELAVLTRPGAPSRSRETHDVRTLLSELRIETIPIETPATLEGGDVLKIGRTVYVGRSSRTNREGISALRSILEPHGYEVIDVLVDRVLHLKTAVTALPDGTVVGFPEDLSDTSAFEKFLPMPERGAALVVLSPTSVLMAASVPKSIESVRSQGYEVVPVDISEFEKLEGCVTCLSVRLRMPSRTL